MILSLVIKGIMSVNTLPANTNETPVIKTRDFQTVSPLIQETQNNYSPSESGELNLIFPSIEYLFKPGSSISNFSFISPESQIPNLENSFNFPPADAPSLDDVKNSGASIFYNQVGDAVAEIKNRLSKLGYLVTINRTFDFSTETAVKQLQQKNNLEPSGIFNTATLNALENAERPNTFFSGLMFDLFNSRVGKAVGGAFGTIKNSAVVKTVGNVIETEKNNVKQGFVSLKDFASRKGASIAEAARRVANSRGTVGRCFAGVKETLRKFGVNLVGGSAYMAAPQLAKNANFKEIKVAKSELKELPPGAIIVWGKSKLKKHGHITVALGNGKEASDHVQKLIQNGPYGGYRVFIPKEKGAA